MLSKKYKISVVALLLILATLPASATTFINPDNIDQILENLIRDDYFVSYEAEEVVIYFSSSEPKIERYKLGKLKPHTMKREKFRIDGSLEEVMVHDDELKIVSYPKRGMAIRTPLSKNKKPVASNEEVVELIKSNYDVILDNHDAVSGRKAFAFSISPKERGSRPAFKIWADYETGLILKTEAYSSKGVLTYLSSLSNITINPSFSNNYFAIMVPRGTIAYEPASPSMKRHSPEVVKQKWDNLKLLSGGYILKDAMEDERGQLQFLYHDGLNNISIFSEKWNTENKVALDKKGPDHLIEKININGFEGFFCRRGKENIMSFISNHRRFTVVGAVSKGGLVNISRDLKKRSLIK